MVNVQEYCSGVHKHMTVWKAGLYDILNKVDAMTTQEKETMSSAISHLRALIDEVDAGLSALENACPSDWSPNKAAIDSTMNQLEEVLSGLVEKVGVRLADTTAWI